MCLVPQQLESLCVHPCVLLWGYFSVLTLVQKSSFFRAVCILSSNEGTRGSHSPSGLFLLAVTHVILLSCACIVLLVCQKLYLYNYFRDHLLCTEFLGLSLPRGLAGWCHFDLALGLILLK